MKIKKKKLIPYFMMMIVLCLSVISVDLCEDVITPNQQCEVVTPTISCTNYTYNIFHENSTFLETGNLTLFNGSIYYFNFTQIVGDYYVVLCDGTTRQLVVGGDEEMAWIAVAIFLVFMTGFLGFGANMIREPAYKPLKTLMFILFIVNVFMLGIMAYISSVNAFDIAAFQTIGLGYAGVNIFMIGAFGINFVYKTLYKKFKKGTNTMQGAFSTKK